MSTYRHLKSNAHNQAQGFISLLNWQGNLHVIDHLMLAARDSGARRLVADIEAARVEPLAMATPPILESIRRNFRTWGLGTASAEDSVVRSTQLIVDVQLPQDGSTLARAIARIRVAVTGHDPRARLTCTVTYEDDRGRSVSKTVVREYSAGILGG